MDSFGTLIISYDLGASSLLHASDENSMAKCCLKTVRTP